MPGQPQVRQHSWLYLPGDDIPVAVVRVEQHKDGTGQWTVLHAAPASDPDRRRVHDSPEAAYADAQRLRDLISDAYRTERGITGRWDIHAREPY